MFNAVYVGSRGIYSVLGPPNDQRYLTTLGVAHVFLAFYPRERGPFILSLSQTILWLPLVPNTVDPGFSSSRSN